MPKAKISTNPELSQFEQQIKKLSNEDLKDLLLVNTYKLAMTRAQLEALADLLIKKKVINYEEYWKITNEKFRDVKA
jgi:hypothetical protein